jgi:hypothetical protein
MTDESTQGPAEDLTQTQSEAVRRLLAGAREDGGIPDDVAARLDAVLADLSAERAATPPDADVIPLRRRWPKVLVAAAAVTLFGFGAVQLMGDGANDAGSGDVASGAREDEPRDLPESGAPLDLGRSIAPDAQAPNAPQPGDQSGDNAALDGLGTALTLSQRSLDRIGLQGLRQLRPGTLDRDLSELTRTSAAENSGHPNAYDAQSSRIRCGPFYSVSGGETFAALYRRHLALVLFHPSLDGVRLVEIYDCESATPRRAIRTVTLQAGE